MIQLSRFYPIFDSSEWIERLVPLGIKLVQLRMKDCTEAHLREEIQKAKAVCDQHGCALVINDYWQLAIELGGEWIHLGQEDLDTADIEKIKQAGLNIGISTHDEEELARACQLSPDYIALGLCLSDHFEKDEMASTRVRKSHRVERKNRSNPFGGDWWHVRRTS
ncbi:thiamine phosphate synthase [Marinomonas sp. GJ51-6]|uniref:thiamine phosphate synthase n=1 Tax=Marinomonas sp. GJ51-6 TaxID=2992802 RepID=UPI00293471D6|nr:thiamine phosphate synthase [Marinomonas sp. GJ51-6]WOD07138.1 thiamine phosphate synthase [Marinomonas sp. GJ51-6]